MPLYQSLTYIKKKVEELLNAPVEIYLDSIGKDDVKEGVYISLLYTEEEKTLKNNNFLQPYYEGTDEAKELKGYSKVGPKIYLNLYVLITSCVQDYGEALKHISQVIAGFRNKNVFIRRVEKENGKLVVKENDFGDNFEKLEKLIFDIHTLNFDQNSSLWQSIGTKLYPYIVYKVRTIAFAPTGDTDKKALIKDIWGYVHPSSDPKNDAEKYKENIKTSKQSEVINKKNNIVIVNSREELPSRKQN